MKVVCFGDSQGNFRRTFDKITLLLKKQQFDCLLCLGDLFSRDTKEETIEELLNGKFALGLPTYFSVGTLGLPSRILEVARERGQVCDNLFLLDGVGGQLQIANGPNVCYWTPADEGDHGTGLKPFKHSDILLSARKPASTPATFISHSAPKYLFYRSDEYKDGAPYAVQSPSEAGAPRLVREVGLASVANLHKAKWFYAFNLTDDSPDALAIQAAKRFPYNSENSGSNKEHKETAAPAPIKTTKESKADPKRPPEAYICKICSLAGDHYFKECPNRAQSRKRKRGADDTALATHVDPSSCFFCLSNPDLARHLIVSIGDNGSYLVLPKGGMTQHHVIILPIDHKPTMTSLADSRAAVEVEMDRYINALEEFYESMDLVGVVFEISRASGVHFHVQMMPVPADKLKDLEDAFFAFAETEDIVLEHKSPATTDENFFRVRMPSTSTSLVGALRPSKRFDLQFGRRVISDVMGVPERAHWKDCLRTHEQEAADAELFKSLFKPFDFTL